MTEPYKGILPIAPTIFHDNGDLDLMDLRAVSESGREAEEAREVHSAESDTLVQSRYKRVRGSVLGLVRSLLLATTSASLHHTPTVKASSILMQQYF